MLCRLWKGVRVSLVRVRNREPARGKPPPVVARAATNRPSLPTGMKERDRKPHLPCKQGMATSVALQPQLTAYGGSFY